MAFTYGGDPENSNRDAVRLMINDTSTGPQELSDAEIAWLIASHPDNWFAASAGAMLKSSKFAALATSKQVGDLKVDFASRGESRAEEYRSLSEQLKLIALRRGVKPAVGGISISQRVTDLSDTDWDQPEFKIGQNDFNGASSTGSF